MPQRDLIATIEAEKKLKTKEEQQRQALEEEQRLKKNILLKPQVESGSIWDTIVNEYKKQLKNVPEKDGCLVFPSRESASQFFEGMAKQNLPFLVAEVDISRKTTGFFMYSCGNGTLFQGSLANIKNEITKDLTKNPDDSKLKEGLEFINERLAAEPKNAASTMREALDSIKDNKSEPKLHSPSLKN